MHLGITVHATMPWVDTHCHLQLDERSSEELLRRAPDVAWIVAPGVDAASSRASLDLAVEFPGRVLATAGLHPHDAESWPSQRDAIAGLASKVAAIGETGLDYYRDLSSRHSQKASLVEQIELARDVDLPIIIHCRDAFSDTFDVIEQTGAGPRCVLHSWTGGTRWTRRFLDLGVTFSFSGLVAFDTADTIRLGAELVPADRALVETDTPYLTPPPHRGEPNEPAWVALAGRALARVWGMREAEVADITSHNASAVFR